MLQMKSGLTRWTGAELNAPSCIGAYRSLFTMETIFHVPHDHIVAAHRLIGELKTIGPMRGDALLLPGNEAGGNGSFFNRPHEPGS